MHKPRGYPQRLGRFRHSICDREYKSCKLTRRASLAIGADRLCYLAMERRVCQTRRPVTGPPRDPSVLWTSHASEHSRPLSTRALSQATRYSVQSYRPPNTPSLLDPAGGETALDKWALELVPAGVERACRSNRRVGGVCANPRHCDLHRHINSPVAVARRPR